MDPNPVLGLWFALEDATLENGCLWAIPGAHTTPIKTRMMRNKEDQIFHEVYDETPWDLSKMVPLEVKRGTLIVLHGLLPHMSKENKSDRSRHAYALHIVSNDLPYSNQNWLQRTKEFPFCGF
jgi:phytanoyl-CoA hydroxylase